MLTSSSRRLAAAAVSTLAALTAACVAAAAPAHAADWTTVLSVHKAKTQLCKTPVPGGYRVKIRLDDRTSDHAHLAGMSTGAEGASVDVKAAAGEVSKVRSLVVRRGDDLVVGMGEPTGEGMGGDQSLTRIGAC
ncbi:hypothetical protein G5V58_23365 [Nocardioides anomalus]|uniref:Uncharacterized protein n=1 Tax=Nocardioides anomalus TaxID=2712223 RepID=A0A6G6WJG3_9ACTN|nr:hypothetical protein [Nocardioides anomalus]QIG45297.1 hypothetical protein G5V58_23365 [Nocardioides anomalus]